MILIDNLTVKINDFIKKYNDLSVNKGEVVMITGENGSGKTILLNTICGLVSNYEGYISLNKINIKNDKWKNFTAAFIGREFLIPYLTPLEYFEICLLLAKKEANDKLVNLYAGKIFFEDFNKKIRNLSLGNQKKVGLISTLITEPHILIWDEPFANLDKKSSDALNQLLLNLSKSGKTILYTNHPNQKTFYTQKYAV